MDENRVEVRIGTELFVTSIAARGHEALADEPGALGGADAGPTPYEFLLGAVGACKAITAKMYAERKGWALTDVHIALVHDRPEGRGGPERIRAELSFEGDLNDEQRQRLLEIAEKCPVQKTVTGELTVESAMRADG